MKAIKDRYIATRKHFNEVLLLVYKRFRKYVGDNYAFGFAFQSTSRDFILFAPNLST